jgi:predicted nucleotidyltransferase
MSEFTYNPKLDYLACCTLSKPTFQNIRQVEIHKKSFRDSTISTGNIAEVYHLEQVKTIYFQLKEGDLNAAHETYDEIMLAPVLTTKRDVISHFFLNDLPLNSESFFTLLKEVNEHYEFLSLVFNAKRVRASLLPITFSKSDFEALLLALDAAVAFSEATTFDDLYRFNELKSQRLNRSLVTPLSATTINTTLQVAVNQNALTNLGVQHILLYGNYAVQEETVYSTIDLNLFFETIPNREVIKEVLKLLDDLFEEKADVLISLTSSFDDFKTEVGSDNYLEIF